MANITTIARPYAKAIFEHALAADTLSSWSVILYSLALGVLDEAVSQILASAIVTTEQKTELLMALFPQEDELRELIKNFVVVLGHHKRLLLLPEIQAGFEALRAEQEKTLAVAVTSFSELSTSQQEQLSLSLSQRLKRQITLDISVDKSLLGGVIVQAGDWVIDGSVRGKLNKLSNELAA